MKYLAAYALFALAGKTPSVDDIKNLLKTVNADVNDADLKKVVDSLAGKQINEVISQGLSKVGSLSVGGGSSAAAPAAKGGKDEKKDEKKEEKKAAAAPPPPAEEEEVDMGDLFGGF